MAASVNSKSGLVFNPNWGYKIGCFPADIPGLTDGGTVPDGTAAYQAWTPNVIQLMSTDDKKALESKAIDVQSKLRRLRTDANAALEGYKALDAAVTKTGGEITQDVGVSWGHADAMLTNMSTSRMEAFTELDMLMVYAPTPAGAQQLCEQKLQAAATNQQILDKIAEVSKDVNQKITDYYKKQDDWLSMLLKIFQAFIDLIAGLIALVKDLFIGGIQFIGWLSDHPKIAMGGGAVLGLLILGLILRPYIAIAAAVFFKHRKRLK